MTDYTQNTFFTAKDSLPADDPDKLILGVDIDVELLEIQTTQATKYDSSDIATLAQAEAGTSNSVLMTPLRTSQLLVGGGTGAGIIGDLIALTDPGDDRILFWDESADTTDFLDIGVGLEITAGKVLNVTIASLDHDSLSGFVADEHVGMSTITFTAGVGISGGGTLAANRTYDLDIDGLTQELTLDTAADFIAFFDTSAGVERKVPLQDFIGSKLGDGKWYKSTTTAMSHLVEITIAYNTEDYDTLERGTFSTSTGEYTVGANATRILVSAYATATAPENTSLDLNIQVNGVTKTHMGIVHSEGPGTSGVSPTVASTLNLASGDVVRIRALSFGPATPILAGVANNAISIVELG